MEEQHDEERGDALGISRKVLLLEYEALKIPSLSGMNLLIGSPVSNLELNNVFNLPRIPGPASDYSAIYSALKVTHGISTWASGEGTKTIISVDLDLYEKQYMLVSCRADLQSMFVLCLGELHIVFAYLRAIRTFVQSSGIDLAWMKSKWFGENTLKQVLTCSRIRWALECREDTYLALHIMFIKSLSILHPEVVEESYIDLVKMTQSCKMLLNQKIQILSNIN